MSGAGGRHYHGSSPRQAGVGGASAGVFARLEAGQLAAVGVDFQLACWRFIA